MKKYFDWNLIPLQNRIQKQLPRESTSFFMAFSIVAPIMIYHLVSQFLIILFSYFMQWVSLQEGQAVLLADWLRTNSVLISGLVKGLSMLAGTAAVFPLFLKETPMIGMPSSYKKDVITVFLLGGSAALAVNILLALLNVTSSSETYDRVAQRQFALPVWAGIVLYGLISPIAEEVVFRGLVYNRLYRQYSKWMAMIGSSLLFGVYHGNLIQMVYGFFLGFLMAVLYEKYGSFLVPVLMHSAANVFVYIATSTVEIQKICMNSVTLLVSAILFMGLLTLCMTRTKNK